MTRDEFLKTYYKLDTNETEIIHLLRKYHGQDLYYKIFQAGIFAFNMQLAYNYFAARLDIEYRLCFDRGWTYAETYYKLHKTKVTYGYSEKIFLNGTAV